MDSVTVEKCTWVYPNRNTWIHEIRWALEHEMRHTLRAMNSRKAVGPDGIPGRGLQTFPVPGCHTSLSEVFYGCPTPKEEHCQEPQWLPFSNTCNYEVLWEFSPTSCQISRHHSNSSLMRELNAASWLYPSKHADLDHWSFFSTPS